MPCYDWTKETTACLLELLNCADNELKVALLDQLYKVSDKTINKYITGLLLDADPMVRAYAAACLINDKTAGQGAEKILKVLSCSADEKNLMALVEVLPLINRRDLTDWARPYLCRGGDLGKAALVAFIRLNEPEAIDVLAKTILGQGIDNRKFLLELRPFLSGHQLIQLDFKLIENAIKAKFNLNKWGQINNNLLNYLDIDVLEKIAKAYDILNLKQSLSFVNSVLDARKNLNLDETKL